jgi:hypothetical protein
MIEQNRFLRASPESLLTQFETMYISSVFATRECIFDNDNVSIRFNAAGGKQCVENFNDELGGLEALMSAALATNAALKHQHVRVLCVVCMCCFDWYFLW